MSDVRAHETLPERVWWFLVTTGPNYAAAVAANLNARDAAVTGALRSLLRQERVEVDGRAGRRVYYRARGAAEPAPVLATATHTALDMDVILLRAAAPSCEIEALMIGNRPIV